ncbi:MAG: hypothetical protein NWF00_02245 [Candidatus Bathyarchaeota archaeon]|nr:hypothetical protein [Candidatus Bathyarchaeota archaeon]
MDRKTLQAILLSSFLVSLVVGMPVIEGAKANPVPYPPAPSTDLPTLHVPPPKNYSSAYACNSFDLRFTVIEPSSWDSYKDQLGIIYDPIIGEFSVYVYLDGNLSFSRRYEGTPNQLVYRYNVTFNNLTSKQHTARIEVVAAAFYTTNANYSRSTYQTNISQTVAFRIYPESQTILFTQNTMERTQDPYPTLPAATPTHTPSTTPSASNSSSTPPPSPYPNKTPSNPPVTTDDDTGLLTYGGTKDDGALALIRTSDGGYALAGYTRSYGAGSDDFWLVKLDGALNMEWNKTFGGAGSDIATCLVETVQGGFVVGGYTNASGNLDFLVVKTDASGEMLWSRTYGGAKAEFAFSLVQVSDGGYAVAGYTLSFGAGRDDCWLIKFDSAGDLEWSQTYGGLDDDGAVSLIHTADGGYVFLGMLESFGHSDTDDFWLIKTDAAGNMQ